MSNIVSVIHPSTLYSRNCSYEGDWSTWDDPRLATRVQFLHQNKDFATFHAAPLILHFYCLLLCVLYLLNSGASSLSTLQENKQKCFLLLEFGTRYLGLERIYTNVRTCTHTYIHIYIYSTIFLSCFFKLQDYRNTEKSLRLRTLST